MSNVVGPIFAVVSILVMLYFGLGQVSILSDQAGVDINESSDMYESLQTADSITQNTFNLLSWLPYFLGFVALIGGLYMLLELSR